MTAVSTQLQSGAVDVAAKASTATSASSGVQTWCAGHRGRCGTDECFDRRDRDERVAGRPDRAAGDRRRATHQRPRGAGIPDDELPHVTQRFYRGRYAQEQAIPGVGLGLHIAQQIAAAHDGALTVTSAGPGHGTVAALSLTAV